MKTKSARDLLTSSARINVLFCGSNAPINVNPVRGECGQGVGI